MFASLSASSDSTDDTAGITLVPGYPAAFTTAGRSMATRSGMHNSRPACWSPPARAMCRSRSRQSAAAARGAGRRAAPLVGARGARILPRRSPPRSRCDSVTSPPVRAPARSRRSSDPPSAVQRSGRARGPSRARAWVPGVRRRRTRTASPEVAHDRVQRFGRVPERRCDLGGRPALQQVRAQRLVAALGRVAGSAKNSPPGRGWGDLADWTIQIVHLISRTEPPANPPPTATGPENQRISPKHRVAVTLLANRELSSTSRTACKVK